MNNRKIVKADFQIVEQLNFIRSLFTRFCEQKENCPVRFFLEPHIQHIWVLMQNGATRKELFYYFYYIFREITYCIYQEKDINYVVELLFDWQLTYKKNIPAEMLYDITWYVGYYFESVSKEYINTEFVISNKETVKIHSYSIGYFPDKSFQLDCLYKYSHNKDNETHESLGVVIPFTLHISNWTEIELFFNTEKIDNNLLDKTFEQLRNGLYENSMSFVSCEVLTDSIIVSYSSKEGILNINFIDARIYIDYGDYIVKRLIEENFYVFKKELAKKIWNAVKEHYLHYNSLIFSQNMRDGSFFIVTYPLIEAIIHTDLSIVKLLIETEYEDESAFVNVENHYGQTPLYVACKLGKKDIADYLLFHGAKISLEYTDEQNKREVDRLLYEAIIEEKN